MEYPYFVKILISNSNGNYLFYIETLLPEIIADQRFPQREEIYHGYFPCRVIEYIIW